MINTKSDKSKYYTILTKYRLVRPLRQTLVAKSKFDIHTLITFMNMRSYPTVRYGGGAF